MSGDFWSRRRAAVAQEAEAETAAVVAAEAEAVEAARAEMSDEDLLAEANLPVPEAIETPEQVREFLSSALPQRLKTRALRRLWRLNPVLANVDGLVDYGEDFTDSATVIENLQTAYQVGKGMLAHVEELARQAEAAAAEASDVDTDDDAETETPDDAETDATDAPIAMAQTPADPMPEAAPIPVLTDDTSQMPPAPRRRMTFTFDEQRTV